MISIYNLKDVCTICNEPFKHRRVKIKLLEDPLPRVKLTTCHAACLRQRKYDILKELIRKFFLEKGVRVLDLE